MKCFNGAAADRPRNGRGPAQGDSRPDASMGPRPIGRGMIPDDNGLPVQLMASMGPRPIGRGMLSVQRGTRFGRSASMGPRPIGRGMAADNDTLDRLCELQWGRGRSAAE